MGRRGTLEKHTWHARLGAYGGRRKRGGFYYEAYVPDEIADWDLLLPGDVSEVINEAEREIIKLNREPPKVPALEALARQLLRAESLASSRIEGLVLSHRRLAKAAADSQPSPDFNAREVLNNILAMEKAIDIASTANPFKPEDLAEIHEVLFRGTRDDAIAGVIRDRQNWIGGDSDSPRNAEFIPPPSNHVDRLLEDLASFMNRDDLPTVAQAAIAHSQFETIHPFMDGNGRVGRCLIHAVLRRRGIAPRFVPPISLILATDVKAYVRGLTDFRDGDDAGWCAVFAQATRTAAVKADDFADEITGLQERWMERAGNPRARSTPRAIIEALPAHPIIDVRVAREVAGVSDVAAGRALKRLETADVLQLETKGQRRGRSWEARELFELLNEFERNLATPGGDGKPSRPAPV